MNFKTIEDYIYQANFLLQNMDSRQQFDQAKDMLDIAVVLLQKGWRLWDNVNFILGGMSADDAESRCNRGAFVDREQKREQK